MSSEAGATPPPATPPPAAAEEGLKKPGEKLQDASEDIVVAIEEVPLILNPFKRHVHKRFFHVAELSAAFRGPTSDVLLLSCISHCIVTPPASLEAYLSAQRVLLSGGAPVPGIFSLGRGPRRRRRLCSKL